MEKLIVLILCLPLLTYGHYIDMTTRLLGHGENVVDAAIEKIRSECLFDDDKLLMKRIAAVETNCGKNIHPNQGGIWKVTNNILSSVQGMCQVAMRQVCNRLTQRFTFDVSTATMQQMDIPLYSAITMLTYITGLQKAVPASIAAQAIFWKQHIHTAGDTSAYIAKSNFKASCTAVKMDVVFAIEASGSVGYTNFQKSLDFVEDVVDSLSISAQMTRVSVIRYATSATETIAFGAYNSVPALKRAINVIIYTGGRTDTHKAIDMARTKIFTKARRNVPKVFVLITDSVSSNRFATIAAADKLKEDNVEIFTIGVGNVNEYDMLKVASSPNCTHYLHLQSYTELNTIVYEIQHKLCTAAVVVTGNGAWGVIDNNNNIIPYGNTGITRNYIIPANITGSKPGKLISVKVTANCGEVYIYGSNTFMRPSAAIFAYTAKATDGSPGIMRSQSELDLYLSIVSKRRPDISNTICQHAHYNVAVNPVDSGVTIICRENEVARRCTPQDMAQQFGQYCHPNTIGNPCTLTNILNGRMRFRHPYYSNKYIQCKVTGRMEIVTCPTGTLYSEQQKVCDPQIISPPRGSILYTGANPCKPNALFNRQFYFANPSSKNSFIQCNGQGTPYLVYCQGNLVWSQQASTCVSASASSHTNLCTSAQVSLHANPANKKSFISCDGNGNAFVMPCAIGTVWSQNLQTCVHDILDPPTNTQPVVTIICTSVGQYIAHPTDTNKYYHCDAGKRPLKMKCPAGLVWKGRWCGWA